MNKFIKVCLITAAIMIGVGLFTGLVVAAIGGPSYIVDRVNDGTFTISPRFFPGNINWHLDLDWGRNWRDDEIDDRWNYLEVNGVRMSEHSYTDIIDRVGIEHLDISIGVGEFELRPHDRDSYELRLRGIGDCYFYVEGDTLHFTGFDLSGRTIPGATVNRNRITLFVPRDVYLESLTIDVGVGMAKVEKLTADTLTATVGVGQLNMKDMDVRELEMETSVGSTEYHGSIRGDVRVSCQTGAVNLRVRGSQTDFDYEIDNSLGSITVGRDMVAVSGLNHSRDINNGADKKMTLDCSVGAIGVTFY